MNKAEFIRYLSKENDITQAKAEEYVNIVLNGLQKALSEETDSIAFTGFGSFIKSKREARVGHHPKTKEKIDLKAYNQVSFKVGKTLKSLCQ